MEEHDCVDCGDICDCGAGSEITCDGCEDCNNPHEWWSEEDDEEE